MILKKIFGYILAVLLLLALSVPLIAYGGLGAFIFAITSTTVIVLMLFIITWLIS